MAIEHAFVSQDGLGNGHSEENDALSPLPVDYENELRNAV